MPLLVGWELVWPRPSDVANGLVTPGPEAKEVGPGGGQTERAVGTASHVVRIVIVLAIIFPKAHLADVESPTTLQCQEVAARTGKGSTLWPRLDIVKRLHSKKAYRVGGYP